MSKGMKIGISVVAGLVLIQMIGRAAGGLFAQLASVVLSLTGTLAVLAAIGLAGYGIYLFVSRRNETRVNPENVTLPYPSNSYENPYRSEENLGNYVPPGGNPYTGSYESPFSGVSYPQNQDASPVPPVSMEPITPENPNSRYAPPKVEGNDGRGGIEPPKFDQRAS